MLRRSCPLQRYKSLSSTEICRVQKCWKFRELKLQTFRRTELLSIVTLEHFVFWTNLGPFFDPLFVPLATSYNLCCPNFISVLQPSPDAISIDRRAQAISIIILTPGLQEFYETNSPLHGRLVIWFCLRTNSNACTSLIPFCHLDSKTIHWGTFGQTVALCVCDTDAAASHFLSFLEAEC